MSSNRRGKIKEHLEGIHRNTEAIKTHCIKCLELVGDDNPKVSEVVVKLAEVSDVLDEFARSTWTMI